MEVTSERISFTFDPREVLLSLHIGGQKFLMLPLRESLVFEPSSETNAPRLRIPEYRRLKFGP